MNTITLQTTTPTPLTSTRKPEATTGSPALGIGITLAASIVSFFGALTTLGKVNWPQYLEYPAARALPHLSGQLPILTQGYWLYLLSVLFLLPLLVFASQVLPQRLGTASVALGTAAVLFKALGIGRWLFAMPYLITTYAAATDTLTRRALEIQYETLNRYAGGIGEQFGVALFTALWLAILTLGTLRLPSRGRFVAVPIGAITTALLIFEIVVYTAGGNVGPLRTIASILSWLFLALFAISSRKAVATKP